MKDEVYDVLRDAVDRIADLSDMSEGEAEDLFEDLLEAAKRHV
jgi:hypothetical protein